MRAVVAIAVLGVLAAAADAVGTLALERSAAQRAEQALDAPVDVELEGWPVTVRALTGSIPRASVTSTDVPLTEGGATLSRVEATLTDVETRDAGDALAAGELPPATGGSWSAELGAADLRAALPETGQPRLADGVIRLTFAGVELDANLTAEDGRLVVVPTAPLLDWARLELGFEELPGAPAVEGVEVTPQAIRVEGNLHPPPPRRG